jgi:hypothetical protein
MHGVPKESISHDVQVKFKTCCWCSRTRKAQLLNDHVFGTMYVKDVRRTASMVLLLCY